MVFLFRYALPEYWFYSHSPRYLSSPIFFSPYVFTAAFALYWNTFEKPHNNDYSYVEKLSLAKDDSHTIGEASYDNFIYVKCILIKYNSFTYFITVRI